MKYEDRIDRERSVRETRRETTRARTNSQATANRVHAYLRQLYKKQRGDSQSRIHSYGNAPF